MARLCRACKKELLLAKSPGVYCGLVRRSAPRSCGVRCGGSVVTAVEAQPSIGAARDLIIRDGVLNWRNVAIPALLVAPKRHGCLQAAPRTIKTKARLGARRKHKHKYKHKQSYRLRSLFHQEQHRLCYVNVGDFALARPILSLMPCAECDLTQFPRMSLHSPRCLQQCTIKIDLMIAPEPPRSSNCLSSCRYKDTLLVVSWTIYSGRPDSLVACREEVRRRVLFTSGEIEIP